MAYFLYKSLYGIYFDNKMIVVSLRCNYKNWFVYSIKLKK